MHRSIGRTLAFGGLMASALALAACDTGTTVLWPWFEADDEKPAQTAENEIPPPPPTTPVDPINPDATPTPAPDVPNPNANEGAPPEGTPAPSVPENPSVPISDNSPPVSAETGEPVPALPPPVEPDPATPSPPPPPPPAPSEPVKPSFYFFRAGVLEPSSGLGSIDTAVLAPDMAFPIKDAPAFPQSQVYRYGGGVKGGDQCDTRNFQAPWRDNYCETRSSGGSSFCSKTGVHLGQDIRVGTPEGCKAEVKTKAADRARYEVVAAEDGVVSNVGSYSISIRANSGGRIYRYLHLNMNKLKVAQGQAVKKGDVVGYVSNDFGGTPTTLHLHFEIKVNTAEAGWQWAPPYTSLLEAYKRRENNPGEAVADNFAVATAPR